MLRLEDSQSLPIRKTTQNIVTFVQQVLADVSNDLRAQKRYFEIHAEKGDLALVFDPYLLKRARKIFI